MLTYCILFYRIPWWSRAPGNFCHPRKTRHIDHYYLHRRAPRSCPGCWLWCGGWAIFWIRSPF